MPPILSQHMEAAVRVQDVMTEEDHRANSDRPARGANQRVTVFYVTVQFVPSEQFFDDVSAIVGTSAGVLSGAQSVSRHGDGLHFEPSGSFLKCVVVMNCCVKYWGSSTIVVTLIHSSAPGPWKRSKYSVRTAFAL